MFSIPIVLAGHVVCRGITARVPTQEDDIHEDFKPKFKAEAEPRSAPSATDQIKQDITEHDVFLYMKVWHPLFPAADVPS